MAVSFLIAAQFRGRRPFGSARVSSPFTSAPALIDNIASVTLPAITASHKATCRCGTTGSAAGCNPDAAAGARSPADPTAAGGN